MLDNPFFQLGGQVHQFQHSPTSATNAQRATRNGPRLVIGICCFKEVESYWARIFAGLGLLLRIPGEVSHSYFYFQPACAHVILFWCFEQGQNMFQTHPNFKTE